MPHESKQPLPVILWASRHVAIHVSEHEIHIATGFFVGSLGCNTRSTRTPTVDGDPKRLKLIAYGVRFGVVGVLLGDQDTGQLWTIDIPVDDIGNEESSYKWEKIR